jgi:hypothetical protein
MLTRLPSWNIPRVPLLEPDSSEIESSHGLHAVGVGVQKLERYVIGTDRGQQLCHLEEHYSKIST